MPIGYVLVRDARGHVKHDDAALAVDVVSVAETAEFFLPRGVPDVELDAAVVLEVGVEVSRVAIVVGESLGWSLSLCLGLPL